MSAREPTGFVSTSAVRLAPPQPSIGLIHKRRRTASAERKVFRGMPERLKISQARFPLLDREARLVGWSDEAPFFRRTTLRHPEAEQLVGTPIVIVPALLMEDAHVLLAGGTPNHDGLWVLAIAHGNCIRHMPIVIRGA